MANPGLSRSGGDIVVEPCPKRVRVQFGGEVIADSRRVLLLHERGLVPVYYFPWEDIRTLRFVPGERTNHCPRKGDACYWDLVVGGHRAPNAVWSYPAPFSHCPDLSGFAAFYWGSMDAWFEEDEEVFVHPRDPYTRIDVLESSRHVRIEVGGTTIADSTRPLILFETGLPPRYYLPKLDIRLELLRPTPTVTACPYKGVTSTYWTVFTGDITVADAAWCYDHPNPEVFRIAGRTAFFDERVDVYVAGELQDKPHTQWQP